MTAGPESESGSGRSTESNPGGEPDPGTGPEPRPGRIDKLIVNSPYEEPRRHWSYGGDGTGFVLAQGRRPAGYLMSGGSGAPAAGRGRGRLDYPGDGGDGFEPLELAQQLRGRVKEWREAGYPGVTGVTKRLLEHWRDRDGFEDRKLFFCQMEAAETLIWLKEAPEDARTGIGIPADGSPFPRICSKMATGAGKTVVMAMLAAWHVCNKAAYPNDARWSRHVLVIAPGLTVRSRLGVLDPQHPDNYYEEFRIVPAAHRDKLRQGRVEVRNWHVLQSDDAERAARRRGVDKRGPRSNEAWIRDVLGAMSRARNLLVINDEAHHAWRVPPEASTAEFAKADLEEATKWVGGLDRIHRVRGILACHDFTATPFIPSGRGRGRSGGGGGRGAPKAGRGEGGERLFGWVVSDFGLNDAIESGLVKTPRVVVRDDAGVDPKTYRSRMYHIYDDNSVKGDLNRRAAETEPLPDLVRAAYRLLGHDWAAAFEEWRKAGHPVPPVMISVTNRTETAARLKHAFDSGQLGVEGLWSPELTLHVDSKALAKAELSETPIADPAGDGPAGEAGSGAGGSGGGTGGSRSREGPGDGSETGGSRGRGGRGRGPTRNEAAEMLRRQVDTVGVEGRPGQAIRHVISVAMLSEGWDAKTVTHIMGLRAFTSQLLCEQVIGRGLRRTSYEISRDGLFEPEFVNIFGVPFAFLPAEDHGPAVPLPPQPKTEIRPDPAKSDLEISFPNVVRVEHTVRPELSLDLTGVEPLVLDGPLPTRAVLAESIQGRADETRTHDIDPEPRRLQTLLFGAAQELYGKLRGGLPAGNRAVLCVQLMRLLEGFVASDRVAGPAGVDRRVLVEQHRQAIVGHMAGAVRAANVEGIEPVFDVERPILSTADMDRWWTGKHNGPAAKSHINRCVYDSALEEFVARGLDASDRVAAWVKNDHLGFEVAYMHGGVQRRYIPDFIVRLAGGAGEDGAGVARGDSRGREGDGRAAISARGSDDRMLVLEVKGDPLDIDRSKEKYLEDWARAVNAHGGFGRWSCAMYLPGDDLDRLLAEASPPGAVTPPQ